MLTGYAGEVHGDLECAVRIDVRHAVISQGFGWFHPDNARWQFRGAYREVPAVPAPPSRLDRRRSHLEGVSGDDSFVRRPLGGFPVRAAYLAEDADRHHREYNGSHGEQR